MTRIGDRGFFNVPPSPTSKNLELVFNLRMQLYSFHQGWIVMYRYLRNASDLMTSEKHENPTL